MTEVSTFRPTQISPGVVVPIHSCRSEWVGVLQADKAYRLVAAQPIVAGTRLFHIEGERTNQPTRYSVQIGENLHIDLGNSYGAAEIFDRYFWRFMNHSCDPNTLIRDGAVIAIRDIPRWADVTFNYNTTEFDIAEPFECHCGSQDCRKAIKGFLHLPPTERERLRPLLAPHLIALIDRSAEPASA